MLNEESTKFEYSINESRFNEYIINIKDYCFTNGLISLVKTNETNVKQQQHDQAFHLPVTLLPSKFPEHEYKFALEIQQYFNELIFLISNDHEFLKEALKDVILVDDFTRRLWELYLKVHQEGVAQPVSLAIIRNDFMLDKNKANSKLTSLSQIEINTISCSFGAATSNVARLHDYLLNDTNNQNFTHKHAKNENINVLAESIVNAWEMYENPKSTVVFLVSENERNIGDQRLLEYKCLEFNSSIKIKRYCFREVADRGRLDDQKRLFVDNEEVAIVYYRAGYDPSDYYGEKEWDARLLIERSKAIKCPNVQTHLVGAKIVQQKLFEPGSVERFIKNKDIVDKIRATFVDLYAINNENIEHIIQLINEKSQEFVLKPQREGGGHNIYKEDIKTFLSSLQDKKELMGYILMKLVRPYLNQNYIVRAFKEQVKKEELISEIGIYGTYIAKGDRLLKNKTGGYLLRSKSYGVNEGGVASGYSALDSICFI